MSTSNIYQSRGEKDFKAFQRVFFALWKKRYFTDVEQNSWSDSFQTTLVKQKVFHENTQNDYIYAWICLFQ